MSDNQFFDFYTAFTTMFIYVDTADNYDTTAGLANDLGAFHMFFFLFCTLAGAFFLTALLIEVFCGSYDEDLADALKFVHAEGEYCDHAVVAIWERHSSHAQAIMSLKSEGSEKCVSYEQGLTFDSFVDLVFSTCIDKNDPVIQECGTLIAIIVEKLEAHQMQQGVEHTSLSLAEQRIVHELLNICAETSLTDLFNKLQCLTAGTHVSIADWRVLRLISMGVDPTAMANISWDEVQWARGRSPCNNDLGDAIAALPRLKGLLEPSHKSTRLCELHNLTCRVLRLEYLRKWCVHRVFTFLDKSDDGLISPREFRLVWPMVQTVTKMTAGKPIRAEGYMMGIEVEIEKLRTGRLNAAEFEESELEEIVSTYHSIQMAETGLVQVRQTYETSEVFGQYADETSNGIPLSKLPEALLDGIFDWNSKDCMLAHANQITSELRYCQAQYEVSSVFELGHAQVATFVEFVDLRQRLMTLGLESHLETMSESDRALLLLTRERAHLMEYQKTTACGFTSCEAVLFTLCQGVAWSKVFVMSLYYTTKSTTTLDWLLVVLSVLQWGQQTHLWWAGGHGMGGGTAVCMYISLLGVVAIIVDSSDLLPMGTARFVCGFSTVTIFTYNIRFNNLMTTVSTMTQLAWPLVGTLMAVTCLYALTAREIFKGNGE